MQSIIERPSTERVHGNALPASRFIRQHLRLPLTNLRAPRAFICPLCAAYHPAGHPASVYTFGPNFNDYNALAGVYNRPPGESNHGKPLVCGDCLPFLNKPMLRLFSNVLITEDGGFAVRGDGTGEITTSQVVSYILLHPPKPPFFLTVSNAGATSLAHMVWKNVLTMDTGLIRLRFVPRSFGSRMLTICRRKMENILAISKRLGLVTPLPKTAAAARIISEAQARGEAWTEWRRVRSLFEPGGLDFNGTAEQHGLPSRTAFQKCTPAELREILSLSPGDQWALAYLCGNRPPSPPPRLELPKLDPAALADSDAD